MEDEMRNMIEILCDTIRSTPSGCECCPYFDENDKDSCPCWNLLHN